MEQTKRGRACEHEIRRFRTLLDELPQVKSRPSEDVVVEDVSAGHVSIASLASTGCLVIDRTTVVLAGLLEEISRLNTLASETHFPALLLFAEDVSVEDDECATIHLVSSFLPTLHAISTFLSRVNQLFRNLLQQIRAFHQLKSAVLPGANDRQLSRVWRGLGELLALLIQADEICASRPAIRRAWQVYMRALETAQHNPSQFGTSADQLRPLISTLALIEGHVMAGNGLRNCYEQSVGELDDDGSFAVRMKHVILQMFSKWEKAAEADVPEKRRLMTIVGLAVFYHLHFSKPDKKVIKSVWNCHKKVVVFHLLGDILWSPCQFLLREVPELASMVDKKSQLTVNNYDTSLDREAMLSEAIQLLPSVEEWQTELRLETRKARSADPASSLKLSELVLKGARLSDTLSRQLKTVLNGNHGAVRMSKSTAYKVFQVVETVKSICRSFRSHWRQLAEACQLACQQWRCHVLAALDRVRTSLREAADEHRLAAIQIAIEALLSTACRTRLTVCGVALELAQYEKLFRSAEMGQLEGLLSRLHTLYQPRQLVQRVSDCSFLVFHRSLIDIFWDTVLDRMPSNDAIEDFSSALSDCVVFVSKASHLSAGGGQQSSATIFQKYVYEAMRKGFLAPLCAFVENDLRVLTHKHLVVDERDNTAQENCDFYRRALRSGHIRIHDRSVDVKEFVSQYLEKTFYNLTAVALHDCHTYSRMASLAEQRYGIVLTSGDLPHHSIDQGLDIIHLVRSMHLFTSHFNYCVNQQVFFEKDSPNRSLRVVTSSQMAASLRTHGCGVLNTSVNVVYQLVRKRLATVSQFLSDEHIKAQLQRDRRHFDENKDSYQQMFPVKRAEKFNRAIARLGESDDQMTYMDKIRQVVTQIGNAVGFVRSMAAAAAEIGGRAKEFDDGMEWAVLGEDGDDDDGTRTLRRLLEDSREQTGRNRNYIKLLVDVFSSAFADRDRFAHLDNWHILQPALMLNYMQHMLTCRERLRKRSQHGREMTFVDDGFVLGISYLLSIFRQWDQFGSLNWMQSLRAKLESDASAVRDEMADTVDRRADRLRCSRMTQNYEEFEQMLFTFTSARVFFSYDDDN